MGHMGMMHMVTGAVAKRIMAITMSLLLVFTMLTVPLASAGTAYAERTDPDTGERMMAKVDFDYDAQKTQWDLGSAGFYDWICFVADNYIAQCAESGDDDTRWQLMKHDAEGALNIIQNSKWKKYTKLGNENDATSMQMFVQAVDGISEWNYYRSKDTNFTGLEDVKISCTLMARAQVNANASAYTFNHMDNVQGNDSARGYLDNQYESLAWGRFDPFDGWYTQEKADYDKGQHDFEVTGHYQMLVEPTSKPLGGFAISYLNSENMLSPCFSAELSHNTTGRLDFGWTVDEFYDLLDIYVDQFSPYFWSRFDDIRYGKDWVDTEGWLAYVMTAGLMSGYERKSADAPYLFGANDNVTRAQVATILYRFVYPDRVDTYSKSNGGTYESVADTTGYKDARSGQFYTAALNWMKKAGIMTGDTDKKGNPTGTFRPGDPISRAELAVTLQRFAKRAGADVSNTSNAWSKAPGAKDVPSWAKEGIAWCYANKVLTGRGDTGNLEAQSSATRAAMAKMSTVVIRDLIPNE